MLIMCNDAETPRPFPTFPTHSFAFPAMTCDRLVASTLLVPRPSEYIQHQPGDPRTVSKMEIYVGSVGNLPKNEVIVIVGLRCAPETGPVVNTDEGSMKTTIVAPIMLGETGPLFSMSFSSRH